MGNQCRNRLELRGDRTAIETAFSSFTPIPRPIIIPMSSSEEDDVHCLPPESCSQERAKEAGLELYAAPIDFNAIDPKPPESYFQAAADSAAAERRRNRTSLFSRILGALLDWWSPPLPASRWERVWEDEHWGTGDPFETVEHREGDSICFSTAHAAPLPLMRTLSRKHPTLTVILEWCADADYVPRRLELRNGEGEETAFDSPSEEGKAIRVSLYGNNPWPEESDEEAQRE